MKTLLLLRHAKSNWDDFNLRDFDRPLAQRGIKDAPRIGQYLKQQGPAPDLIVSSPAVRAKQTVEAVIIATGLDVTPRFDEHIYGAASADLMRLVRSISNASRCAMIVGHNPGFEDLLSRLTGSSRHMPTAGLACVEFTVESWADIEDGEGKLAWFVSPKMLAA